VAEKKSPSVDEAALRALNIGCKTNQSCRAPHPEIQPNAPRCLEAGILIEGDRFRHDRDGDPAHLCIIHDSGGWPVDVVAWFQDAPGRWYLHDGLGPILGAWNLAVARGWGDSITIHPTPCDWIKAGGSGFVVFDWEINLLRLFDGVPQIETGHLDAITAVKLTRQLRENFRHFLPKLGGRNAA